MKTIKVIISFIIIFIVSTQYAFASQKRKAFVLAGDYWCPYNCEPGSDQPGFLVELARRALYIYGIDIVYEKMPWSKVLENLQDGKIDGVIGISNIEGRKLVTTRLPLEYSTSHAFTKANTDWVYDGIKSLNGRKLGIIMDYMMDESINNYIGMTYTRSPGMFLVEDGENAVIDSIANVIDGDVDLYIEDDRVVKFYIKKTGLTEFIRDAGVVSKIKLPIYIAFSENIKDIDKYIQYFEDGIASLKATGEYDDLKQRYGID